LLMGGHTVLPQAQGGPLPPPPPASANPEEIDLGSSDVEDEAAGPPMPTTGAAINPEEVDIGSDINEADERERAHEYEEDPMFRPVQF